MKKSWLILAIFSVLTAAEMIAPKEAQADAKKEVLATARAIIEAFNDGDRDTMKKLHANFHSAFDPWGGLLTMPRDLDEESSAEQADSEEDENTDQSGRLKFSHWKHPEIHVNGNMAFLTGYLVGTRTVDGQNKTVHWRDTCIFEKHDGEWVRIHHHTSPLIATTE